MAEGAPEKRRFPWFGVLAGAGLTLGGLLAFDMVQPDEIWAHMEGNFDNFKEGMATIFRGKYNGPLEGLVDPHTLDNLSEGDEDRLRFAIENLIDNWGDAKYITDEAIPELISGKAQAPGVVGQVVDVFQGEFPLGTGY